MDDQRASEQVRTLARELLQRSARWKRRWLLGIAGLPGAGKSTFAARLADAVCQLRPGFAKVAPMDGFHLDNADLDALNLRPFKGSPRTFDEAGYINLLRLIKAGDEPVPFPIYDRDLHEPVWRDSPQQTVGPGVGLVITEGNYLLLDQQPWDELADVLDECWWYDVPQELATQRIIARHIRGGRTPQDAQAHFARSDAHNMELVLKHRRQPDRTIPGT